MIRVRVDMVPFGLEDAVHTITEIRIINVADHPDRPVYGNYKVEVEKAGKVKQITIENHNRGDGFWPLLSRVAEEMGKDG